MTAVPLTDVHDDGAHGGKAVQLGQALRAGLPVPPGFAISHEHVDAIASEGADRVAGRLHDAFAALGGPVAVRSSAVGEDSAGASFAGQHATVLGVACARTLLAAIRRVRESAHAPSALAYRRRLGLHGTPRMGVVVQRLIDADKAGVLFTKNPVTGEDERIIEAAWGLGEVVVAGLVTPDRFRIERCGRIAERTAGDKDIMIRLRSDGGTDETAVDAVRAGTLCLDDREVAALHDLATRCEGSPATPVDIEWAFAGDRLYLLQRRAITRAA